MLAPELEALGAAWTWPMVIIAENDARMRLLKHVRRAGRLSRVELAQRSGLSKAFVTDQTAALIAKGMLREAASPSSGRGRPRIDLSIVADGAFAVGLFPLPHGMASVGVVNLNGDAVTTARLPFAPSGVKDFAARAGSLVEQILAQSGVARERVRHAIVAAAAHVDRVRGVVHWMPGSAQHGPEPVGRMVADMLGMPVTVDNRASVIARAEHWFGADTLANDFTCIALLERGMGGARYHGGSLQSGAHGMNFEYAHVKVAFEGGRRCFCGATGCLAAYASVVGILQHAAGERAVDLGEPADAAFAGLLGRAEAGEGEAQALFDTAGRALGTAIASHINEVDPGRIVLMVAKAGFMAAIRPSVLATLAEHVIPTLRDRSSVEFREITEADYWRGTTALALAQLY